MKHILINDLSKSEPIIGFSENEKSNTFLSELIIDLGYAWDV